MDRTKIEGIIAILCAILILTLCIKSVAMPQTKYHIAAILYAIGSVEAALAGISKLRFTHIG